MLSDPREQLGRGQLKDVTCREAWTVICVQAAGLGGGRGLPLEAKLEAGFGFFRLHYYIFVGNIIALQWFVSFQCTMK